MRKLPLAIITNILSRLPIKPLCRFKSVSKSWYSLIKSPNFIKLHLNQTLASNTHTQFFISHYTLSSADLISDNLGKNHVIKFTNLDHPLKNLRDNPAIRIQGSCNGLLCISNYTKSSLFLLNPSTKTHRLIPPFSPHPLSKAVEDLSNPSSINVVSFGFGYDSLSEDYKVFRMVQAHASGDILYYEASVYSLKNDSWRCVNDPTNYVLVNSEPGTLVDEALHFIMGTDTDKKVILCFSLREETFSTLGMPTFDDYSGRFVFLTGNLGGCLCVMVNYVAPGQSSHPNKHVICGLQLKRADLWVVKEYGNEESWVKLFSICNPKSIGSHRFIRPIVYSRDGGRVLIELDGNWLAWYDIQRDRSKNVKLQGAPALNNPFTTWCSVGSLVSLEIDVAQSKEDVMPKKSRRKKNRSKKKDGIVSEDLKLRLANRTNDAANLCNTRDDIISKEFNLRLSNQTEDATDFCNA